MAVETPYTTAARIIALVGELGVDLRTDDVADIDESLEYAVDAGTTDEDFYLSKYSPADIAVNEWCIQNATWFGVRALCLRRLNEVPEGVAKECERREKLLQKVLEGKWRAPRLPNSRRPVTVTNSVVILRNANNQVRVDRSRSTGVAHGYVRPVDDSAPDDR